MRRAMLRATLRRVGDAASQAGVRRELRQVKSLLFYLRHREDWAWRQRVYRQRRCAQLKAHLESLAALPDAQLVNQRRTAGHMKRVIAAKLERYAPQ